MKKTFKDFLQSKGISETDFQAKSVGEMGALYNEFNIEQRKELATQLEEMNKNGATKETLKALETKLTDILKTQGEAITALETGKGKGNESETLLDVIEANKEAIASVFSEDKSISFVVKASTLNANVQSSTIAHRDNTLSPLATRRLTMANVFKKVRIGKNENNTVVYIDWDEATTVKSAAMVAEGGTFPESTAKWKEYTISLKKIGDSMVCSEEFSVDNERFADELENFLKLNVALVEDDQLLTGNDTGNNIKGLNASAVAYVPVASGIQDASFYDLVPKVKESITKGKGNKFNPNIVIMNLTDINKYKLKKDANNNYVMPPFVDKSGNVIDGAVVLENNNVTDNTCFIGDSAYGTIYEGAEGFTISIGYKGDQFVEDMKTLKARKRLGLLIKESEKAAWRKVTSISAALVTLAS